MIRFSLVTLGCKANQYDGEALGQFLADRGAVRTDQAPCDLVVINTCCVTAQAMRKSRQAIRRCLAHSPHAGVLVAGCYSDYDAARIAQVLHALKVPPEKSAIVGHHGDYAACAQQLLTALSGQACPTASVLAGRPDDPAAGGGNDIWMKADTSSHAADAGSSSPSVIRARRQAAVKNKAPGPASLGPLSHFGGHQRAFVKVQDGCDAFCSYCIVPYTRSVVGWRSEDQVADECARLVAAGHREIVLSGVFLGAYGRDTAIRRRWQAGCSPLAGLVRRLAGLEGLWRLRLSSLEPLDLDEDLLAAYRELPVLAPHVHLPLQSGSDPILRRMNRQYTADQFRRTVDRLRETLDRPAITTDVIVGFPGESEQDFQATLDLARRAGFSKIHTFPFSPIQPTAAWLIRQQAAPRDVVRARLAELVRLERDLAGAYREKFVGETVEALVDGKKDETAESAIRNPQSAIESWSALTDRYLTVRFAAPAEPNLLGQIVRLRLEKVTNEGLDGSIAW